MKKYTTIKELMSILKSSRNCGFMGLCKRFCDEINAELNAGAEHYEIAGRYTKSGNPYVFFNHK